jgi:fatty-acyl-CoA synthase
MSPGARGASLPPSYASGMSDVPLLGKDTGDNFDRTVAADPAREALVEVPTGQRWTFAPLRANVDALALGVLQVGVQKDDRAGIWAPNMAEWTLPQNATANTGASLVNINSSRCSRTTTSRTMCSSSRTS